MKNKDPGYFVGRSFRIGFLGAGAAIGLSCSVAHATTIYVNASATGSNNGENWANAYTNLQSALTQGIGEGDQVWVAAAIYKPGSSGTDSFIIVNGADVLGGFAGDETSAEERDPDVNVTILTGDLQDNDGPNFTNRGDNSWRVVKINASTSDSTILDGFTIKGGTADGGALPFWQDRQRRSSIARLRTTLVAMAAAPKCIRATQRFATATSLRTRPRYGAAACTLCKVLPS